MLGIITHSGAYRVTKDPNDPQTFIAVTDDPTFTSAHAHKILFIYNKKPAGNDNPYLVRPFTPDEYIKALEALTGNEKDTSLKRAARPKIRADVHFDRKNKTVTAGQITSALTEKEFLLLSLLTENKGTTVSDTEIDEKVWGCRDSQSNITAVYINYLRKKIDDIIGKKYILRIRGKGYMIEK